MSETAIRERLRSALEALLHHLPAESDDPLSRDNITLLPAQEVRAAAECLTSLGLLGDAIQMAEVWGDIQRWMIGPLFDEWLVEEAASEPDKGESLRECFGRFPSPEEFAASSLDRKTTEAELIRGFRQLADLILQLHATFVRSPAPIEIQGATVPMDARPARLAICGDNPPPETAPASPFSETEIEEDAVVQRVTLDQMAAIVTQSKRTLEKWKTRKNNPLPTPDVEGGGGKADKWVWSVIRPWLEGAVGFKLPERYPADRFRDARADRS
jgi:hypothetical protein